MSLKGEISHTELLNTIDDARKGKKKAIKKLSERHQKGFLSTEEYNKILTEYRINKSRKIKALLCIVLLVSLSVIAVVYHNNSIDDAYYEGIRSGYTKGYDKGYDKGYAHYERIKDEYNFFHKYAVRVTTTGKKYHRYDCYHVKGKSFYIFNISEAEGQGYTPCLDCYY